MLGACSFSLAGSQRPSSRRSTPLQPTRAPGSRNAKPTHVGTQHARGINPHTQRGEALQQPSRGARFLRLFSMEGDAVCVAAVVDVDAALTSEGERAAAVGEDAGEESGESSAAAAKEDDAEAATYADPLDDPNLSKTQRKKIIKRKLCVPSQGLMCLGCSQLERRWRSRYRSTA
jgi:hypothetical protein